MKTLAFLISAVLGFGMVVGQSAYAQTDTTTGLSESAAEAIQDQSRVLDELKRELLDDEREIPQEVRDEVEALLEITSENIEAMNTWEIYGIGVGILAGAVAADLAGGGGLFILGAAAAGGLLGKVIADYAVD